MSTDKLEFNEEKHEYTLDGKKLISVTQLMQKHGLAPNYAGVSSEVLNAKAERGTLIHEEIEAYNKRGEIGFTEEVNEFAAYIKVNDVQVIASEKRVHNDIVAGTIDLLLTQGEKLDEEGNPIEFGQDIIADIKTTYNLHKEAVSWQLSIYLWLYLNYDNRYLDEDWDGFKAQVYHFDRDGNLNVVDIPLKSVKEVDRLFACERTGEIYQPIHYVEMESEIDILTNLMEKKKILDAQIEQCKEHLINQIREHGNYADEKISIAYVGPSVRSSFDSAKFKKEHADLFNEYTKESITKESLRITLKGAKDE